MTVPTSPNALQLTLAGQRPALRTYLQAGSLRYDVVTSLLYERPRRECCRHHLSLLPRHVPTACARGAGAILPALRRAGRKGFGFRRAVADDPRRLPGGPQERPAV